MRRRHAFMLAHVRERANLSVYGDTKLLPCPPEMETIPVYTQAPCFRSGPCQRETRPRLTGRSQSCALAALSEKDASSCLRRQQAFDLAPVSYTRRSPHGFQFSSPRNLNSLPTRRWARSRGREGRGRRTPRRAPPRARVCRLSLAAS
jgi:hypothetical protein